MFSFIRMLFYRMPNVGDVYRFDDDNPWTDHKVKIVDIKKGWVKYSHPHGTIGTSPLGMFHFWYVKD